jgi:hypothetical protein
MAEGRSKEPIRDATSEQIKEADQRRKVRSDKPRIRAATKIKNQHGSEDAVSLVRLTL